MSRTPRAPQRIATRRRAQSSHSSAAAVQLGDALNFFDQQGQFTCRQFAQAARISRQAALKHLQRAANAGLLVIHGCGRGVTYAAPPQKPAAFYRETFWEELQRETKSFIYVGVQHTVGPRCRTRHQAEYLMGQLIQRFIVLDFAGVQWVAEPFARGLVKAIHSLLRRPQIINASGQITDAIARAERAWSIKPHSEYGT